MIRKYNQIHTQFKSHPCLFRINCYVPVWSQPNRETLSSDKKKNVRRRFPPNCVQWVQPGGHCSPSGPITSHDCSLKPGISGGTRLLKAPTFEELAVATTGLRGLSAPPIVEPKLIGNEKSVATFGRGILRMILPEVMRRPKPSWWAKA